MNRVESPEINKHIHGQLIFVKCAKTIQWERYSFQQMLDNRIAKDKRKKIKLDPYFTSYKKLSQNRAKA